MEIPVLAKMMELDNLYHIYLFYVDDRWCAFGCSAYYLSIMYPELDDFADARCPRWSRIRAAGRRSGRAPARGWDAASR